MSGVAATVAPVLQLGGAASPAGEPAPIAELREAELVVPLTLRVLTGPLEGADAPLPESEAITVGRGFRNDVVLRDKSVGDARISLEARGGVVRLRVLSGAVMLLGQRLTASSEAVLPPYLPLAIGASALAVGRADEARWAEGAALVPLLTEAPANDPAPRAKGGVAWAKDVGVGLCAFGALAACTIFLVPGEEEALVTPPAEVVRSVVAGGGYDEVTVTAQADGDAVGVSGFVTTDARKAQLLAALDASGTAWTGELRSGEAAARQVGELFASNGLSADADYLGGGRVAVSGVEADEATAARVRRSALSDVPYLADITVERSEPETTFPSAAFTAEIEKVVGGEFAYVVTRDGERHFEGATTPQGGRIVRIDEGAVTIEDAGEPMTYTF